MEGGTAANAHPGELSDAATGRGVRGGASLEHEVYLPPVDPICGLRVGSGRRLRWLSASKSVQRGIKMRSAKARIICYSLQSNSASADMIYVCGARACNRSAAFHGRRFAPVCSAYGVFPPRKNQ